MAVKKLLNVINEAKAEKVSFEKIFSDNFIENDVLTVDSIKENEVESYVASLHDSQKTALGNKLSILENICNEKSVKAEEFKATEYINKTNTAKQVIRKLIEFYDAEMQLEEEALAKEKAAKAASQGDITRAAQEISDLKNDINKANTAIDKVQDKIEKQSDAFDSKVFQVLMNTVSLLGIFVAIAFAGFGSMTIFTNIDIQTWMQSTESFIKNTFILLATSLLSYNLLLLLIYFIYKLSRPLVSFKKKDNATNGEYQNNFKLWPFVVIDVILLILTVVLFVWCVFYSEGDASSINETVTELSQRIII